MRSRHSTGNSSLLLSIPVIALLVVSALALAFSGYTELALIVFAIVFVAIISRLYGFLCTKNVETMIKSSMKAGFPGARICVDVEIENNKLLPMPWINIYMPIPSNGAVTIPFVRKTESFEQPMLASIGANTAEVGEMRCKAIPWYGSVRYTVELFAKKRGLVHLNQWRVDTGDIFGLTEESLTFSNGGVVVIYPQIVPVTIKPLVGNLWNSTTGTNGIMDDISVIKSTRLYQTTDNPKHINWRLLSRAMPLMVNSYEQITPKSIHLIFDGESFSSPNGHLDEMEDAISLIASALMELRKAGINVYLSLPSGSSGECVTLDDRDGLESMLFKLAQYDVMEEKLDSDGVFIIRQEASFCEGDIIQTLQEVGHVFYICYSLSIVGDNRFLSMIKNRNLTVLEYVNSLDSNYLSAPLASLRRDG